MTASRRVWGIVLLVLALVVMYRAIMFELEPLGSLPLIDRWRDSPNAASEREWLAVLARKRAAEREVRVIGFLIGGILMVPGLWLAIRKRRDAESAVPVLR
jgi:hypothetical protein